MINRGRSYTETRRLGSGLVCDVRSYVRIPRLKMHPGPATRPRCCPKGSNLLQCSKGWAYSRVTTASNLNRGYVGDSQIPAFFQRPTRLRVLGRLFLVKSAYLFKSVEYMGHDALKGCVVARAIQVHTCPPVAPQLPEQCRCYYIYQTFILCPFIVPYSISQILSSITAYTSYNTRTTLRDSTTSFSSVKTWL